MLIFMLCRVTYYASRSWAHIVAPGGPTEKSTGSNFPTSPNRFQQNFRSPAIFHIGIRTSPTRILAQTCPHDKSKHKPWRWFRPPPPLPASTIITLPEHLQHHIYQPSRSRWCRSGAALDCIVICRKSRR